MSDELREYDLSAWDAPPPPRGLADAVIARMTAAAPVTAVESEPSRRWWIAGTALAGVAVAAIALVIVLGGSHRAASGHGDVVATRAQRLDLDTASAELDTGADVSWRRQRDALVVEQRRGSATWRVANDTLRIDAGATVASVEATGASLRVEVHMQMSDARVVGASALTAAAVAFVTVVVYEGHVKVTASGQTVNVEPGATVEVRPGQPPAPPALVGHDDDVKRLQQQVQDLQQQLDQQKVGGGPPAPTPAPAPAIDKRALFAAMQPGVTACAEKHQGRGNFELRFRTRDDGSFDASTFQLTMNNASTSGSVDDLATCMKDVVAHTKFPAGASEFDFVFPVSPLLADALDRAAITDGIRSAHDEIMRCGEQHPAKGTVKVHVRVAADGNVTNVDVTATPDAELGACVASHVQGIQFARSKNGGSFSYPFVFDGKICDAEALNEKGRNDEAIGQHASALASFEAALRCKDDPRTVALAFMSACSMANVNKARTYYARLAPERRPMMVQMCVRNGIKPEQLEAGLPAAGTGLLEIHSRPAAHILIDGKDTKLVTPITGNRLPLAPGKHKVTFVVGQDRYTYPVTIEAGQTAVLDKTLE